MMTSVVVLLAVVVALLTILVIGLLRSYGEVLRRLHDAGLGVEQARPDDEVADIARRLEAGVAPPRQGEPVVAEVIDVAGVSPHGDAVSVGLARSDHVTMLAFLSSGCATCSGFWASLRSGERLVVGDGDVRVVVVTGGPNNESPRTVAALAGPDLTVVMSDDAWQHYAVPATPYFVLIDGVQGIVGEGSAMGWGQLVGLMERAVGDRGFQLRPTTGVIDLRHDDRGPVRERRADDALLAAGIGPGDRQLYDSPLAAPIEASPSERGETR